MSKYLALDLGQVIYDIDIDTFIKELEYYIRAFSHRNGDYDSEAFVYDLHGQQDIGITTISRAMRDTFGFSNKTINILTDAWLNIPKPNEEMMEWVKDLEDNHNVKIALLSNIGKTHAHLIGEKFPETFKNKILHLSCEVGARKPTKLYYQSFLWDHPEFKGCLYLDDRLENIEAGKQYGFLAEKFDLEEFNKLSPENRKNQLDYLKSLLGI